LFFEAAVGGGIPIIKTSERAWRAMRFNGFPVSSTAICNTFSRYGDQNLPFEVCPNEAQRLGYAEADPTFDVGGFDTAHKLGDSPGLAFGAKIDAGAVSVEGS
jgi:homoserine dehydrogenase